MKQKNSFQSKKPSKQQKQRISPFFSEGDIRTENVSFKDASLAEFILKNINLTIPREKLQQSWERVDDNSIVSHQESVLEIIKYYDLALIIGERTQGTTGDIIEITNSGLNYVFAELVAERNNGERFLGIEPDIKISFQDWFGKGYKSVVDYAAGLLMPNLSDYQLRSAPIIFV